MHHYPHNIGDFDKATRHLTRIERSIYRDLIELYYDTEQMLPLDVSSLCRLVLARSNEEATAVEQALNEFFSKTPTGWYHARCEAEIEKYRSNASQQAKAGKASAAARALKAQQALNENPSDVERALNGTATEPQPTGNGERLTVNGKTGTVNQKQSKSKDLSAPSAQTTKNGTRLPADWVLPKAWRDFALSEKPNWTEQDVRRVADDFRDHWLANANQAKSKKADWLATWRKWVRSPLNEIKRANGGRDLEAERRAFVGEGEIIEGEINHVG